MYYLFLNDIFINAKNYLLQVSKNLYFQTLWEFHATLQSVPFSALSFA